MGCSAPNQNSNQSSPSGNSDTKPAGARDGLNVTSSPTFSSYEDSLNDLTLDKGQRSLVVLPSKPVNFIDFSKLQLEKTSDTLLITYAIKERFKNLKEATLIRFELTIWTTDSQPKYYVQTNYFKESWNSLLIRNTGGSAMKEFLPGTVIGDKQIIVKCPLRFLNELPLQFTWSATAQYSGKSLLKAGVPYEEAAKDSIPNEGRAVFPSP
jgi:hypothetical protein